MESVVQEFERDCIELDIQSHNYVGHQEIQLINKRLMKYQSIDGAYLISFSSLSSSKNPVILLQAIILAEASLMKEWENFSIDNFYELMSKLFQVFNNLYKDIQLKSILKRLCHLIARIFKRGHPIFFGNYLNSLLNRVRVTEGEATDIPLEWGYLVLFNAIIHEYSEVSSSFLFLTSDDMIVFRSEFENTYLFHIFELTLHIVFVRIIHGFVHEVFSPVYLETTFEILDQILSWRFDVTRDYFKYICFQESQVDFEPPASWSESIARFNLCTLVFYLLQSFSSSPQLCPIVRSVLLQYSSIRFRDIDYDYIDLHMSNFLINFSRVVPAACHIGDSSVLWCLCSVIRKFVETPIKITWGEKYTTKLLKIILENGDVFIHLINTISKELKGCCDDIYIDSANEFFSFVLKLRDFMTKYNVFMFNESKIFFQNLKQIGADLLEQDLIQPLGHLEVSSPKTRSIIDKFNSSDEDEHTFWMDDSAYIMIPELSLFIADKLVAHLKLVVNGFDGEKQLPDSHMFYNLNRLVGLFVNSLIDATSNCFMYYGANYLHDTSSISETTNYINNYFLWYRKRSFDDIPNIFLCSNPTVNGHIQCLVLILISWQLIISHIEPTFQTLPMIFNQADQSNLSPSRLSQTILHPLRQKPFTSSYDSISSDTWRVLTSILKFLGYFPLFFEKIMVLYYKGGELVFDDIETTISFLQPCDRDRFISVIFENIYILFTRYPDITPVNDLCTSVLKKVIESVNQYTLMNAKWGFDVSRQLLSLLVEINASPSEEPRVISNIMSLFMQSSMFCGLKDGPENLLHSLVRVIEPKFTRDANNFPATGFQSQEDEIHITWMLNLSVLEGLFTKFQVPKRVASKYPLMIANIFELFHKTLASVIGKGGNNYIILRKYIKVNKLFCEKFNYYSPVNIDIRQHLELFEFVCNTYFIYVKNRLPHSMRIEEDNENHKILKIYKEMVRFCVTIIHITDSVMYNRSSVDDLSTADKIFSISKNTIFSIIMSSPSDFFMIPNFTDHIFDAVSEFCLQFKAKLPEMNHQDIAFLIKYIAHGMRSDSVKRKTNLFGSVSKVIDTLNTPNSQYISSKCPSLMNPIIDAIVGIMVKEPVSLDLLDYFCNTFLHLLKWYKDIVMDLIQNFLIANNVSDVIKSKIIQILDTVIQSSHSVQNKRNNFDSSTVSHHFLNLISILRSQNNIDL